MTAVDLTSLLLELDARLKNEAHEAALETCDHILSLAPMDTDVLHSKLVCQVELSNAWGAEAGPIHCPANGSLGGSFCRMAPLYSDWLAANARATSFLDRVLVPQTEMHPLGHQLISPSPHADRYVRLRRQVPRGAAAHRWAYGAG